MSRLIKIGEWSGEKRGNAVFVLYRTRIPGQ